MGNKAVHIVGDMAMKKAKGEIQSKVVNEIASDGVGQAASATFKKTLGVATLFVDFVDTYSKAVKAANLENVRKNLEVCPHIGGCEGNIHAMSLVSRQGITAWQGLDRYWYFHPQQNYKVRHSVQIYRYVADRHNWAIEQPGKPRVQTQDCWACVEAHAGGSD